MEQTKNKLRGVLARW